VELTIHLTNPNDTLEAMFRNGTVEHIRSEPKDPADRTGRINGWFKVVSIVRMTEGTRYGLQEVGLDGEVLWRAPDA
jgi:hypothetical protein